MGPKRITLADVAIEAGVSVQTASHVLSGNMKVRLPERTRQRVKDAAERVGYRPNRLAQAMKRGKSHVIGVWLPVDRPILSYLRFLQVVSSTARDQNYELMITGLQGTDAYGATGKAPQLWPVDGIMGFDAGKAITALRENPAFDSIPVLIFGYETCPNGDSVAWDVAEASKDVTRRLIARGCRRIVHVTMDWILSDFPREQRRRGYSEAMLEAGLSPEFVTSEKESSSAAETAVFRFIEEQGIPDAFTGFTDPLAIGAARAVLSVG
ncbi:MAG: LacI family DNA-binding transcriptional regulator, partial [Fimbriimonadaceae bacterium]|nr:LacI family DNA-binding transcriptional regulator [Fimbriimonadaceae bacterium]